MAKPGKVKWLSRSLLAGGGPYLCLVRTEAEWLGAFADMGVHPDPIPASHGRCVTLTNASGELAAIVLIQASESRTPIEIAGLIVHEAVHVFQAYMRHIGEGNVGDETHAYMVQIIAQRLMAAWCGQEHS